MDFSTWLTEKMRERDLNNTGLALKIGVSDVAVGFWLRRKTIPDLESCRKLAEFFNVPTETVLSLAGHLEPVDPNTAEERQVLYLFRQLPRNAQDMIVAMLHGLTDYLKHQQVDVEQIQRERYMSYVLRLLELATPEQRQRMMEEIRAAARRYQTELKEKEVGAR